MFANQAYKWGMAEYSPLRLRCLMSLAELCGACAEDRGPEGPNFLCEQQKLSYTVLIIPDRSHTGAVNAATASDNKHHNLTRLYYSDHCNQLVEPGSLILLGVMYLDPAGHRQLEINYGFRHF